MGRFTSEDKMLLYIVRATAEEVGGSWDDCTKIYNHLASCPRTQDGLTAAYRALNKKESQAKAHDSAWKEKKKDVRRRLRQIEGSPWSKPRPRRGRLGSDDSTKLLCPTPRRVHMLPWTERGSGKAEMDPEIEAAFSAQQHTLFQPSSPAAGGQVDGAVPWLLQAVQYPLVSTAANAFDAALAAGSADATADGIIYTTADSITYATSGGLGNAALYDIADIATYGASVYGAGGSHICSRCRSGSSAVYGSDRSAVYEAGVSYADPAAVSYADPAAVSYADPAGVSYANPAGVSYADPAGVSYTELSDPSYANGAHGSHMNAADPSCTDLADSLCVHKGGNTLEGMMRSSSILPCSTLFSTSTALPAYLPSDPALDSLPSYVASDGLSQGTTLLSEASNLTIEPMDITNTLSQQGAEDLMSSEELYVLLQENEAL